MGTHCWTMEDPGDTLVPIHFPAGSNFRSHIMDLKYRSPSNKDFLWVKKSDEYKEWYLNNICARDIQRYDQKWTKEVIGPAVNVEIAKYFGQSKQ